MAVKEKVGLVVSDKMEKTVVVAIENRAPHPKVRQNCRQNPSVLKLMMREISVKKAIAFVSVKLALSAAQSAGPSPKSLVQIARSHQSLLFRLLVSGYYLAAN